MKNKNNKKIVCNELIPRKCLPSPRVCLNYSETKNKLHPYYTTGFTDGTEAL